MNLYAVSYNWYIASEYGGLQIWCARDKEHLLSMIIESEIDHCVSDDEDDAYSNGVRRDIAAAVNDAKVLTNESAGMLASFTT